MEEERAACGSNVNKVTLHDGRQAFNVLYENLKTASNLWLMKSRRTSKKTGLVEGCQVAVGERGKENIFFKIVTALVEIEHDALKLHLHWEYSRWDETPDAEAVLLAFSKTCALLRRGCEKLCWH